MATAAQIRKQLEAAEAAEAAANTNGASPSTLVFEDDVPKPQRSQGTAKSHWGIEANLIPLGKRVKLFDGTCDPTEHTGASKPAYIGKPFTMYGLGRCGDHDGQRMHKSCQAPGKAACGGHVFDVRMADNAAGCTSCARKQRKAIEAGK